VQRLKAIYDTMNKDVPVIEAPKRLPVKK
jgi:hypothetical protein